MCSPTFQEKQRGKEKKGKQIYNATSRFADPRERDPEKDWVGPPISRQPGAQNRCVCLVITSLTSMQPCRLLASFG
uniref:Uncharacterized protein n=1 Tax=Rhizophora mucronata TaxID=61149 RepID=A0A2P2QS73_RHIMU